MESWNHYWFNAADVLTELYIWNGCQVPVYNSPWFGYQIHIYTLRGQPTFLCTRLFFFMVAHPVIQIEKQTFVSQDHIIKVASFCSSQFHYKINKNFKTYTGEKATNYSNENRKQVILTSVTKVERYFHYVSFTLDGTWFIGDGKQGRTIGRHNSNTVNKSHHHSGLSHAHGFPSSSSSAEQSCLLPMALGCDEPWIGVKNRERVFLCASPRVYSPKGINGSKPKKARAYGVF